MITSRRLCHILAAAYMRRQISRMEAAMAKSQLLLLIYKQSLILNSKIPFHLGQNGIRDALKDADVVSTMIPIQLLSYVRLCVSLFTFHTVVWTLSPRQLVILCTEQIMDKDLSKRNDIWLKFDGKLFKLRSEWLVVDYSSISLTCWRAQR